MNINPGSLSIVRSYANLSAKKKLISTKDNLFDNKKSNKEKTIPGSKINQSLKLDSLNE